MRIEKKHVELILIFILFLGTLYLWSLPFQKNSLPYGDVDSSVHFSIGEYMADKDDVIYHLPPYINFTQGKWRGGKLWYPPQYHLDMALAKVAGGSNYLPIFFFFALTCSSFVLTSYLLFRKLFGFTTAFFSSFLLMFSTRDILFYIWGLWPQVTSFAIMPLVLYTYYKFVDLSDKNGPIPFLKFIYSKYLILSIIFITVQFCIHPQGALLSGVIILIFSFLYFLKQFIRNKYSLRKIKLPFRLSTLLMGLILLIILVSPFVHFTLSSESKFSQNLSSTFMPKNWSNLFGWYQDIIEKYSKNGDVPPGFGSFKEVHGGYSILFFFLAGLGFLIFRRKNQDLLLLSWIIAFHLLVNFIEFRPHRLVETEALFVYPIALIGINVAAELTNKFIPKSKQFIKCILIALILYLAISTIGVAGYNQLNNAYKTPPMRVSSQQIEAGEWLKENTLETDTIFYLGPYVYGKKKWIRAIAQRQIWFTVGQGASEINKVDLDKDYFVIDYTDLILINSQQEISILKEFEEKILANRQKIYDRNGIKVYKLG